MDVFDLTKRVDMLSLGYVPVLCSKHTYDIPTNQPTRSTTPEHLRECLNAYENDVYTRAEPSVLNSRQACFDAHDFSAILNGSPLVSARLLKEQEN